MPSLESMAREAEEIEISFESPLEFPPALAVICVGRVRECAREMLPTSGLRIPSWAKKSVAKGGVKAAVVTHAEPILLVRAVSRGRRGDPYP